MASESAADTRECDASIQFDVDVLILDYLAYNALHAVLQHASDRPQEKWSKAAAADPPPKDMPFEVTNGLGMVESFLQIFASAHASSDLPRALHFRLGLLRFTALFVLRSTENVSTPSVSALVALREENTKRAKSWLANAGADAFPLLLVNWFKDVDQPKDASTGQSEDPDSSRLPTLLDILPMFVEITAARSNGGESMVGEAWFRLAAELMLQAALEQYIELQRAGKEPIMEAFAWGFEGIASDSDHDDEQTAEADATPLDTNLEDLTAMPLKKMNENVGSVFCELEPLSTKSASSLLRIKANPTWTEIRSDFLQRVLPERVAELSNQSTQTISEPENHTSKTALEHLRQVAAAHPLPAFEDAVLTFLGSMNDSVAKPILTQLELADAARGNTGEGAPSFEIDVDFERLEIGGDEARQLLAQVRRLR